MEANSETYETILFYSSIIMIITGVFTFIALKFVNAPYGRHHSALSASEKTYWGPMIPARFAWMLMESPTLWWCAWFVSQHSFPMGDPHKLILLACFVAHYFHRALLYPLYACSSSASPMPFSIMFLAFSFCFWNGFNQSLSLIVVHHEVSKDFHDNTMPLFIIGVSLFIIGMAINIYSDWDLLQQRREHEKRTKGKRGPKTYIIPRGYFYDLISCPNYGKSVLSHVCVHDSSPISPALSLS